MKSKINEYQESKKSKIEPNKSYQNPKSTLMNDEIFEDQNQ